MAMMNSFASEGEVAAESIGVGGTEAEVGVGLDGSLVGGAIGRVSESRLTCRHMLEFEREWPRLKGGASSRETGGGGIDAVEAALS